MARSSKRRKKRHQFAWKKVDVGLPDNDTEGEPKNHYDEKGLKTAEEDLEAQPGEDVAIFLGLEVIQPDQYRLEQDGTSNSKFIMVNEATNQEPNEDTNEEENTNEPAKEEPKDQQEKPLKKKKKKNKKAKTPPPEDADAETPQDQQEDAVAESKTKNAKDSESNTDIPQDKIVSIQNSWISATGGVLLKESLCRSLVQQGFWSPTPIQAATLPAAILGRRNVVGAAPTGSGKTLSFLLPILQDDDLSSCNKLQALILTPTRELAVQIRDECEKLQRRSCGILVGGFAAPKQARILKRRPPVIVGTPGRLWEMISSREHEHLNDLSQIRYLVIDEADRMIRQGSFPELSRILDAVHKANPLDGDDDESDFSDDEDEDDDRLRGLPGIRGEARVQMLDDSIMARIREQNADAMHEPIELGDSEFKELAEHAEEEEEEESEEDMDLPVAPPVQRQTFIYSATLTLPPSAKFVRPKHWDNKGVDGAIAELLDKTKAAGKTKLVDLTSSKKKVETQDAKQEPTAKGNEAEPPPDRRKVQLPPGLSLRQIKCTQRHKDSHLFAYLVTTQQGTSGPCLVFCNSIAGVRRVGKTLQTLGLPVRLLHAQMQQKARLKAVESLGNPASRSIVIATDVAARGLDIPSVATVVHYDVARTVDLFVHRAGRTARGVGEGAFGSSLSLIAPSEDKLHNKIAGVLRADFKTVNMDGRLLAGAQQRANLACKIVAADEIEGKAKRQNMWFIEKAEEAGLDLDEDLLDEGMAGGDNRDRQQLREAQLAKEQLSRLLSQPLQTQRHGKFLSFNSAANEQVVPFVVPESKTQRKKRKRR